VVRERFSEQKSKDRIEAPAGGKEGEKEPGFEKISDLGRKRIRKKNIERAHSRSGDSEK